MESHVFWTSSVLINAALTECLGEKEARRPTPKWSLAMATLGLKEMGKFLWEGRKKEEKVGKREGQG